MFQLVGDQHRVHRHDYRPQTQHRVERDDELRAVLKVKDHPVALLDTELLLQISGEGVYLTT